MIWDERKRIPHFCNDFKWECFACSCTLKMEKKSPALYLRKLAVHWLMGSSELLSLLSLSCGPPSFCLSLSSLVLWLLVTFPMLWPLVDKLKWREK